MDKQTQKIMFSSAKEDWATPQGLFDKIDAAMHFDLDVCASKENAKCARFFTKEDNALVLPWKGICWMNPPYGRNIGTWVDKAYRESCSSGTAITVCLLPSRTDTRWFQDIVIPYAEFIHFIRGRLKFGGCENPAPFPSLICVFGNAFKMREVEW